MPWASEVLERLGRTMNSVCRITNSEATLGTGFLVGPDLVLTAYHVIKDSLDHGSGELKGSLACVFDDARLPDGGFSDGCAVGVRQCVEWSKYGPAEETSDPDNPSPTENELDYALLKLADAVGSKSVPGKDPQLRRGWIDLRDAGSNLMPNDPIVVIQHPRGSGQYYHASHFDGPNENGTRIRYNNMVEARGSSGSPCLTGDFRIVALHHMGDADWLPAHPAQGVPINLIRERIARANNVAITAFGQEPVGDRPAWDVLFTVLKQNPDAQRCIRDSNEIIGKVTDSIHRLKRYKVIHDVLQDIQSTLPDLKEALRKADPEQSRLAIKRTGRTIAGYWQRRRFSIDEIRREETADHPLEFKWFEEFESAMNVLKELPPGQTLDAFAAAADLGRYVRIQSPTLNGAIIAILQRLPIDELLNVFNNVTDAIASEPIKKLLQQTIERLKSFWITLRRNADEHDEWQKVENDLSLLEDVGSLNNITEQRTFRAVWSRAWTKTVTLCASSPGKSWAIDIQRTGNEINAALDGQQWPVVTGCLAEFHYEMSNQFRFVDQALLDQCEQIIGEMGDPLTLLLEANL